MERWMQTAIVGMGALGMMYGERIGGKLGRDAVCFVADEGRVRRYQDKEFTVNGELRQFSIRDGRKMEPVDLVIVAVKGTGLLAALDVMERCVGKDTTIISVLNGISSEEIIGERFGEEKVVYCVAQGMDAVKFGSALNYSRFGELRIGILQKGDRKGQEAGYQRLAALEAFLSQAGIPYVEEKDILYRLWGKFMLNVGVNQTCMAYETNYGGVLAQKEAYHTMRGAMEEVIRLANLEGIALTGKDMEEYIDLLKTLAPEGMPSMRQDGISHRPSEVELFSGTVRKIAQKYGLAVPVNDWLYEKICGMERAWED